MVLRYKNKFRGTKVADLSSSIKSLLICFVSVFPINEEETSFADTHKV